MFSQLISKTTIHKLIRKGEIPSENFLQKKLIPAWWVEQQIQKAHSPQGGCLMAARRGYYLDPLTGTRKRKAIQAKKRPDLKQKVEQWQTEQKAGMGGARIKVKEWCHLWLHKVIVDAVSPGRGTTMK